MTTAQTAPLTLPAERAEQATRWLRLCNPKLTDHELEVYRLAYERGNAPGQHDEFYRHRKDGKAVA